MPLFHENVLTDGSFGNVARHYADGYDPATDLDFQNWLNEMQRQREEFEMQLQEQDGQLEKLAGETRREVRVREADKDNCQADDPLISRPYCQEWRDHPVKKDSQGKPIKARHNGHDVKVPQGTQLHSTHQGVVRDKGHQPTGAGNWLCVEGADGYVTRYQHLRDIDVEINQQVKKGQRIGKSGNTGASSGPHLHYEEGHLKNKNKSVKDGRCRTPNIKFRRPKHYRDALEPVGETSSLNVHLRGETEDNTPERVKAYVNTYSTPQWVTVEEYWRRRVTDRMARVSADLSARYPQYAHLFNFVPPGNLLASFYHMFNQSYLWYLVGMNYFLLGNFWASWQCFAQSNNRAAMLNNPAIVGRCWYMNGQNLQYFGQLEQARMYYEQALGFATRANDVVTLAAIYFSAGQVRHMQGAFPLALQHYQTAYGYAANIGDVRCAALSLARTGDLHLMTGNRVMATPLYAQALPLFQRLGDGHTVRRLQRWLGR